MSLGFTVDGRIDVISVVSAVEWILDEGVVCTTVNEIFEFY